MKSQAAPALSGSLPSLDAFAYALLDATQPVPQGLKAWNGSDVATRFAVYRNNVAHGLSNVLADTFPALKALVGDEFFAAMARVFVLENPPISPLMHCYGEGLCRWLEAFEPAASLPYLPDIARLEWARLYALHAADANPLAPEALVALVEDPDRLAKASLVTHASLRVVESAFPIVSVWAAHQLEQDARDAELSSIQLSAAEVALVFRNTADDVLVQALPAVDAALISDIVGRMVLGAAHVAHSNADFGACLSLLLHHGLVVGIREPSGSLSHSETSL
jgi:hypothetical protein